MPDKVIHEIQSALFQDPRREVYHGRGSPRDLLFTERVLYWVSRLTDCPSESLVIAAWGHTLNRWEIARDAYPMTTAGYHKWRRALAERSAKDVEGILLQNGTDDGTRRQVSDLILKRNFPKDPDSRLLEDADCLAFLEIKFDQYLDQWDDAKWVRILKGTLEKMTPQAIDLAKEISYSPGASRILELALK